MGQLAPLLALLGGEPQAGLLQLTQANPAVAHPLAQSAFQQKVGSLLGRMPPPLLPPGFPGFLVLPQPPEPIQLVLATRERGPGGRLQGRGLVWIQRHIASA